jgi:hypothetical protein
MYWLRFKFDLIMRLRLQLIAFFSALISIKKPQILSENLWFLSKIAIIFKQNFSPFIYE